MNQTSKRRFPRFAPAVIWMIVIFGFSSRTGDQMNTMLPFFQKLFPHMASFDWGHFLAYFILAAAIDYGIGRKANKISYKLLIIIACGVYGITDEYHQSFVGGRMTDIMDIRNDMIGAAIWVILASIPMIKKRWRKAAP
ncbi:VanZ family protein [Paenibacillus glycanilyticus]|uniref:Teicoplanin resistance protein VanZ n=1 Tax=Paenibacillus glycanilyticus TaxID=126569 RepID=A0ABQ6GBM8_9BACL|nr:VanZ family protein [Paenibacillus glycanilyticus]GLX68356.1 teicoplanin resistance protein VanZ [Paenibacillus glycanilyticus]